jgi:hypothetical protein
MVSLIKKSEWVATEAIDQLSEEEQNETADILRLVCEYIFPIDHMPAGVKGYLPMTLDVLKEAIRDVNDSVAACVVDHIITALNEMVKENANSSNRVFLLGQVECAIYDISVRLREHFSDHDYLTRVTENEAYIGDYEGFKVYASNRYCGFVCLDNQRFGKLKLTEDLVVDLE